MNITSNDGFPWKCKCKDRCPLQTHYFTYIILQEEVVSKSIVVC